MQKKLIAALVAGALTSVSAFAEDAPSPLTFNVGVVSDYLFRGVSQTHGDPALQGGVDYAFSNGFYVGAWGSTISWVKDAYGKGSTEIDLYGGYRGNFAGDWTYDVGYIAYNYPNKGAAISTVNANPNTQEVYAAIGYKWLTAKYSHATSSHFIGWLGGADKTGKTRGSGYFELNAAYDLGDGWGISGHVGHQKVKNYVAVAPNEKADYTDWNIGVTKDVGFGVVGLAYSDTNAKGTCSSSTVVGTSAYCWGNSNFVANSGPSAGFKDVARGTAVLSFKKTF